MPRDPRRVSLVLSIVALGATTVFALYFWAVGDVTAMPLGAGRLVNLVSDCALPVTAAVCVTGAILDRRQRWWFAPAALVAAFIAWNWLVDAGAGEANEYGGVIAAVLLLPPLLVLDVVLVVRTARSEAVDRPT